MHSWFPGALGAMPEDEAVDYWFSEGFNDYLASKVLLGSGIWTLADWAADKNDTLLRYGTSPARTADAAEVSKRFWTDQAMQQVSYDRGHLLAAQVDAAIAARSRGALSLGDVVRAQREAARGSSELATVLFRRTLLDKTGIDFAPEIERHARRGEPLLLAPDLFEGCARIETSRRRTFHRGYDAEATRKADGVITGVVRGGPAYAAGMRDGMKLIERAGGKIGDATVPIAYRVSDQGVEKLFTYLPEGEGEHEVQRMVVTATEPADELRCSAHLGGAQ
jgi:predicted metalloprotease with PDZ domain